MKKETAPALKLRLKFSSNSENEVNEKEKAIHRVKNERNEENEREIRTVECNKKGEIEERWELTFVVFITVSVSTQTQTLMCNTSECEENATRLTCVVLNSSGVVHVVVFTRISWECHLL